VHAVGEIPLTTTQQSTLKDKEEQTTPEHDLELVPQFLKSANIKKNHKKKQPTKH